MLIVVENRIVFVLHERFTATGIAPEFIQGIAPDSHFKQLHLNECKIRNIWHKVVN